MENQTHYDLNAAVENWRNELAAQPNLASDDRRELETHLRDAIAGFQQRGLNDEESFWLARRRVGQPPQIGDEFVKANPAKIWRERIFWMIAAILVTSLLSSISTSLADAVVSYFPLNEKIIDGSAVASLFWIVLTFGIAIYFALGFGSQRFSFLSPLLQNRSRLAIVSILTALSVEIFCATIMLLAFVAYRGVYSPMGSFSFIGKLVLHHMIRNLGLVAFLVWLMPPQNRKTPKHT